MYLHELFICELVILRLKKNNHGGIEDTEKHKGLRTLSITEGYAKTSLAQLFSALSPYSCNICFAEVFTQHGGKKLNIGIELKEPGFCYRRHLRYLVNIYN